MKHKDKQQHQERLNSITNKLVNINQELDQANKKITELEYTETLSRVLHATKAAVEKYMRSADRLLDVIQASRQKRIYAGILTPKQLEPIYRDIQDHYPEFTFPIPGLMWIFMN